MEAKIVSKSLKLGKASVPKYDGRIYMLPFELNNLNSIPEEFIDVVTKMVSSLTNKIGTAYLIVDGRVVKFSETHRKGGAHIDGNYLGSCVQSEDGWGGWSNENVGWSSWNGTGIKIENGHEKSYESSKGGILLLSNYPASRGWNGTFSGHVGKGGDCSHINLPDGFILEQNTIYFGNSQWIHESMPIDKTTHRTIIRITLPLDYEPLL